MNDLKAAIKDYLALRRGLGFKLKKHKIFGRVRLILAKDRRIHDYISSSFAMGHRTAAHQPV
jgi:hypothetical protein